MSELFTISGYIFAVIIAILYEYQRISQLIRKPKNKVQFYVMTNFKDGKPCLCIKDIDDNYLPIADVYHLSRFGD